VPRSGSLVAQRRARLEPEEPAAGAVAAVQHALSARESMLRVFPVSNWNRARYLGIHRRGRDPGRAALFRRGEAGQRVAPQGREPERVSHLLTRVTLYSATYSTPPP